MDGLLTLSVESDDSLPLGCGGSGRGEFDPMIHDQRYSGLRVVPTFEDKDRLDSAPILNVPDNAVLNPKAASLVRLRKPQDFKNGGIHRWYNFVLGFSDTLVSQVMDRLAVEPGQLVFDPFCGTGTTLVESMKRGVASVGIDASPFSCFVSRVKTSRKINPDKLLSILMDVKTAYLAELRKDSVHSASQTYRYLSESGMLKRGWISPGPLRSALTLKKAILAVAPNAAYRDILLLALIADLSTGIGNMKYGPEIYCGQRKRVVDVWGLFQNNVSNIMRDLWAVEGTKLATSKIFKGDARTCSTILREHGIKKVHVAISSPPYPAEHDYTRNTRLELAFLDFVDSADAVRSIKRGMIRSHTKGIYKDDHDASLISDYKDIGDLANRVERRCREKRYGFARLYPTVIKEYFGGMKRHLQSISSIIVPGGHYAIVVGDQASYLGTHIPTAEILGQIAEDCNFTIEEVFVWRARRASTKSKLMKEHALILRRTSK